MANTRNEKGFILVILLFLLLLLAVAATSLNLKAGMQARMAANGQIEAQTYLEQLAVIEQSAWLLTGDPSWRVPAGENYAYQGRTYNRTIASSLISQYTDTIVMSVRAPNAVRTVNKSFRYNIDTPFLIRKPRQVCLDTAGNILFADTVNHSIWKIDVLTGVILRVAGSGASGFSGDSGPASQAQLNSPRGICVDSLGNLYIADTDNNRIRKVAAGFISTVAGISGAYSGPNPPVGDGGLATAARLNSPYVVNVDTSGNLYIADRDNHRIRKVTATTGIITTVAGTGSTTDPVGDGGAATSAMINLPRGVAVDTSGSIYIADTGNERIRKVTAGTGIITTVAGTTGGFSGDGGAATAAQLNKPYGVWLDASGNIFIADTDNHRIRKVTAADGKINTAGNAGYAGDGGAATAARIDGPTGICVKSTGEVMISDTNNSCLRQVSVANTISTVYTVPPMTVAAGLSSPQGAAAYYDAALNKLFLYIADQDNHRIRRLDTVTNTIVTVAGTGNDGYNGDNLAATGRKLDTPQGVSVDAAGNIYIADTYNHRIRKVTASTGIITTVAGTGNNSDPIGDGGAATLAMINFPRGVAVDTLGNIFIADTGNHRIRKFTVDGNITTVAGNGTGAYAGDGGGATLAMINFPRGVAVDTSGNIYIADTNNNRIRKFTVGGNITTVAGISGSYSGSYPPLGDGGVATAAKLNAPRKVALDPAGNIYIADTGNHALRLVNNPGAAINPGVITTLVGTGTSGFNLDSQPAVLAKLSSPGGVALGLTKGGGRIYISDSGNDRVRVLFLKTEPQVYVP